jgi:hypothetical protein
VEQQTEGEDMTTNIKAMLFAIAVSGVSACVDGSPGDHVGGEALDDSSSVVPESAPAQEGEATEQLTEHFDSERAAASGKARRALIGTATITPNFASCGTVGNTSVSVRVNDAALSGSARQRSGSSTSCPAPGQLEPTDDALYYCFTCTTDACDNTGSWTYNKNLSKSPFVSGWTRNDLLKPEPGCAFGGSCNWCGF